MLEALLLLSAAAAAPVAAQAAAATPSLELLEFLAEWPDALPEPSRAATERPHAGEKKDDKSPTRP